MSDEDSIVPPPPHQPGGLRGKRKIHVAGTVYGSWTLVREGEPTPRSVTQWWCRCDCGHEQLIQMANLISGASKRCRDCARNLQRQRPKKPTNITRRTYYAMLERCRNPRHPSYKNYGGRGIKVCERWQASFENFLADMGERPSLRHSIDRINNNGDYCPENCRWATLKEQARNKRDNVFITCGEVTLCLADWAIASGRSSTTISQRLLAGYSPRWAIFGKLDPRGRKKVSKH